MMLFDAYPDIYIPTFEMMVNGSPLKPDIAKKVMQVSVTERLDPPNSFGFQVNDQNLKLIDSQGGVFAEGNRVEISFGYVGSTQKMIVGEISALSPSFPGNGAATLQVDGFDLLHRGTRGIVYRKFEGETPNSGIPDSQIVTQIASEMNLTPSVDDTSVRNEPRVQDHIKNLDFLEELTRANGFFLWVEEETLFFKRQRPASGSLKLERGKTLLSFSPRFSTAGQVESVEVRGWDPLQKQSFSVRVQRSAAAEANLAQTGKQQIAQGAGGQSGLIIRDAPVSSAEEAKTYAETILAGHQETIFSGSGAAPGNPKIRVGTVLELSGMSERFDRSYTVTEVTHTISESGYQTSFQVNNEPSLSAGSISPGADSPRSAASIGDRSRTYGVTAGIVMDNQDPDKLGRIKVRLPGRSDDEIGLWARITTLMAGAERGSFFLPEVDDEVLMIFEQGDITRPYVLGALWNGQDKPPDTNADGENNLRFIKSRSGHLIRFDDTDGAEKIEIIDKSSENHITFDTANNTITINSAQDINLEASQGTIKLNAQNIELSSSAETKIQAQGGATLDGSPGTATIKGATVDIN